MWKTWHFRAFKGQAIASVVTKNAPEFCDVIVINKGQVHSKKEAMKPKLLDGWQHQSIHFLIDGKAKQSIPLRKPNRIVHIERNTCTCFDGSFFFPFINDKYREMCRNGTYDISHANIVNNKNLLCNNSLWNKCNLRSMKMEDTKTSCHHTHAHRMEIWLWYLGLWFFISQVIKVRYLQGHH